MAEQRSSIITMVLGGALLLLAVVIAFTAWKKADDVQKSLEMSHRLQQLEDRLNARLDSLIKALAKNDHAPSDTPGVIKPPPRRDRSARWRTRVHPAHRIVIRQSERIYVTTTTVTNVTPAVCVVHDPAPLPPLRYQPPRRPSSCCPVRDDICDHPLDLQTWRRPQAMPEHRIDHPPLRSIRTPSHTGDDENPMQWSAHN
jgi:hypothetical protein